MANNTIFDDVFQTIKEKMPELTIPLINEAFGTSYSPDTPVILGENEHHTVNGKFITDSHLIIGRNRYHLECQSTEEFSEFAAIENYLEESFLENGQEKDFRDLVEIISKLANYIFSKSENIRKGLGEIMGGKVLELESDRLIKDGIEQGEDALNNLMKKLLDENRMDDLRRITVDKAYRKKLLQEMRDNPKQTA